MRKFIIVAAAAAAAVATPAAANEGRAEVRGGIVWASGAEEGTLGAAVGYDFDLGDSVAFAGVEGSADKVLVDGADIAWGATARLGAKIGQGKLYATGGYTVGEGEDVPHFGAGYEHKLGSRAYVKAEYRRFFSDFIDVNSAVVGVGLNF